MRKADEEVTSSPLAEREGLLVLQDVHKVYQEGEAEREVLKGVNISIRRGEQVVLLGRSGSGKSTLLNLVSGIDLPSAGRIFLGGRDLTQLSEDDRTLFRRRHIGFVFQSFNLIPTLTVAENVGLPLELKGSLDETEEQHVHELLEAVGLGSRGNSFPDRLSGGEQQRVAIARALAHDPLLVLADEPTGNLDYETGQQVMDLIDRLVQQIGKTMLMATHDQDLLERADRILTLQGGRLETTPIERALSSKRPASSS